MKKKYLSLLLLPLLFSSLTSCNSKKVSLTYGTYIGHTIYSLKELNNVELIDKTKNENEVFLLAAYQGEYSKDCLCWSTFESIIAKYINKYNECVYVYDAQNVNPSVEYLNIEKREDSTPQLYIFNGVKQIAKFSQNKKEHKDIFEDVSLSAFEKAVHNKVNKPQLYYVDKEYLDANLSAAREVVIFFMRNECGDCKYALPNVLVPYVKEHVANKSIWLFDMQKYQNQDAALYQDIKDQYGLSESANKTYGYKNGVVPTIQYYQEGVLKDASVFFNDEIAQREDNSWYISDSYYSEERLSNLKYLESANFPTVLVGQDINKDFVLLTKSGGYYLAQKEAAKYHKPILEAFLNYYLS